MYPHERSLVKKYKDRPFTLLGVDFPADQDTPELLRKLREEGVITWRFWYDRPPFPIVRDYQIPGYPMLFLIDHKGIIRDVGLRDPREINERVEELVTDAERAKAAS